MPIQHTAVSYYGINYVEYAEQDFAEMLAHGCDTVVLAITEFDMDFWFPNINAIVQKAHVMPCRRSRRWSIISRSRSPSVGVCYMWARAHPAGWACWTLPNARLPLAFRRKRWSR